MVAGRRVLFKLLGPVLVLAGIFVGLAELPEIFPDHGVVSGAIYEGNLERVRELLDRGADPNVSDEHGQTALARARDMEAPAQLVQLLLEAGARSR